MSDIINIIIYCSGVDNLLAKYGPIRQDKSTKIVVGNYSICFVGCISTLVGKNCVKPPDFAPSSDMFSSTVFHRYNLQAPPLGLTRLAHALATGLVGQIKAERNTYP